MKMSRGQTLEKGKGGALGEIGLPWERVSAPREGWGKHSHTFSSTSLKRMKKTRNLNKEIDLKNI